MHGLLMLANVIDARTNRYDIHCDAEIRPSWLDNGQLGATQFPVIRPNTDMAKPMLALHMPDTNLSEIASLCMTLGFPITAYLYDRGSQSRIQTDLKQVETFIELAAHAQKHSPEKTS